ncbi:MAG: AAA family ATPase, partial [Desulfobacterales bacterium]|nr:AAA family ATPase [Desulfobacterales bacterium]
YGRYFFIIDWTDQGGAGSALEEDRPDFKVVELVENDLRDLALSDEPLSLLTEMIAGQATLSDISPYKAEGPIDAAMFYGRKAELNTIGSRTLTNYLIFGARKSGKTSLLKALDRRFRERFGRDFHIHFHSLQAAGHEDQIGKFYRAIDDGIASVNDFIQHFSSGASERPRVFLLDEVDQFVTAEKERREELFSAMRKLKDEGKAYFIMAGYWDFYRECLDYSSPLYNFGNRVLIKSLDRPSARELLVGPMKRLGIRYESEELIRDILYTAHCRADLIQMICSRMLENLPKIGR